MKKAEKAAEKRERRQAEVESPEDNPIAADDATHS